MQLTSRIKQSLNALLTLALAAFIFGCDDGMESATGGGQINPAPEGVPPTAAASSAILPEAQRSQHFDAVVAKLDLGGTMFEYRDLDGISENLISMAEMLAPALQASGEVPEFDASIIRPIIDDLGLSQIEAYGASSYYDGEYYVSKNLLMIGGAPKGLLSVMGVEPKPFSVLDFAPAGSDIVVEFQVDLPAVYAAIESVARRVGGEVAVGQMKQELQGEEIMPGMTTLAFIQMLDLRVGLTVDIEGQLEMSQEGPKYPTLRVAMQVQGDPQTIESLRNLYLQSLGMPAENLEQLEGLLIAPIPVPQTPEMQSAMPNLSPMLAFAEDNSAFFLTIDRNWFLETRKGGDKFKDAEDIAPLFAKVPSEGNLFYYLSKDAIKMLYDGIEMGLAMSGEPMSEDTEMALNFYKMFIASSLGEGDKHILGSFAVDEGSLFGATVAPVPASMYSGQGSVVTIGLLSAMAIPAFNKVRETSQEKAIINNLRQFSYAADQYFIEEGEIVATMEDIVGPTKYIKTMPAPVAGEDYSQIFPINADFTELSVTKADGTVVTYSY